MNLYESIKNNHAGKIHKSRFIKESAEGGKEFWDKVDAGEIKIGGQLDSDGAGDIDVLDLDKNADYILIKRNSDYQPFVAAWAPEFYNGKLTWGQGHYFDTEDDAREYFNKKAVKECDKPIKEAIDMDRLRAARGRENQQTLDNENKVKDNIHQESCGKKKRPSLKESNPARYLGVRSVLDEAINHANDDINAKIKEALRSKTAARKYAEDFKNAGIKVDDTPREGVNLIGPNGRMLSADRLNVYGPARPGHGKTHDSTSRWGGAKGMKKDLANYDTRITKDKEYLDSLNNMQRDDVIRKYSNKSTDEALAAHKKDIERATDNLSYDKRWRNDKVKDLANLHRERDIVHRSPVSSYDTEIPRDQVYRDPKSNYGRKVVDAIDYKGYLDSKPTDDNKDFGYNGRAPLTKGQIARNEFRNAKANVEDTYYWGSDARRDKADRAIDAKAIEARKKEIEEEYKKKMDDEVNSMLDRKSKADASYSKHKDAYRDRVNKLNTMRSQLGLQTKDEPGFDEYLERKAKKEY